MAIAIGPAVKLQLRELERIAAQASSLYASSKSPGARMVLGSVENLAHSPLCKVSAVHATHTINDCRAMISQAIAIERAYVHPEGE